MRHLSIYSAIREIVERGSIRKASEFLAISPSALNRQILGFEAELGVVLFDRIAGGVRLSTAGEVYYRRFLDHLAEIDGAKATVADLVGLRAGHVCVAVSASLSGHFLPEVVARFRSQFPAVSFDMRSVPSDAFSALLRAGEADLALIVQPTFGSGVATLAATQTPLLAVVPERSAPANGRTRLADLEDHDLILPPLEDGLSDLITLYFKAQRLTASQPPHPALRSAGLLPPRMTAGRPSLQIWPALDLPPDRLAALGAGRSVLERAPDARVALCQAEGRALAPAADRFSRLLSDALSE